MKQKDHFLQPDHESRFVKAVNEDIPDVDIFQFARTFENAWQQRRWYHRLVAKPLFTTLVLAFILSTLFGAGYSALHSQGQANETAITSPILMPGQRIVEQPELLSLFPKVDQPTIISMKPENHQSKQTYLVHGFLADQKVQVVWEY